MVRAQLNIVKHFCISSQDTNILGAYMLSTCSTPKYSHRNQWFPCMWGKTVPMHVGQDGPHECGARRSPCMWGKTVPMHVGQDGPHACGARRSPCMWGKMVPMHVGQDGPHACGARRSLCLIPHAHGHSVANVYHMTNYG